MTQRVEDPGRSHQVQRNPRHRVSRNTKPAARHDLRELEQIRAFYSIPASPPNTERQDVTASFYLSGDTETGRAFYEQRVGMARGSKPDIVVAAGGQLSDRYFSALTMMNRYALTVGASGRRYAPPPEPAPSWAGHRRKASSRVRRQVSEILTRIQISMSVGLVMFVVAIGLARYNVVRSGFMLPLGIAGLTLLVSGVIFLSSTKRLVEVAQGDATARRVKKDVKNDSA